MKQALVFALCVLCGSSVLADTLPRGYQAPLSPMAHNFRMTSFPEPVRWGAKAERFELRHGDCGGSDCGQPRYRAEIQEIPRRASGRVGRDVWYGFSVLTPTLGPVPRDESLRMVLAQWRQSSDRPPAMRLIQLGLGEADFARCATICSPAPDASRDIVLHLDAMAAMFRWDDDRNNGYVCRLFSSRAAQKTWQDVVINTNFSARQDGYVRVWVNDALVCDYRGRIVADPKPTRIQMRRGLFSSFTKRWETKFGLAPKPTHVAYFDEVLTGRARKDVDTRLREQADARPKD